MGTYVCTASNAIGPDAVHEFPVEVHCNFKYLILFISQLSLINFIVKPLVFINHRTEQKKAVKPGDTVSLYCGVCQNSFSK